MKKGLVHIPYIRGKRKPDVSPFLTSVCTGPRLKLQLGLGGGGGGGGGGKELEEESYY